MGHLRWMKITLVRMEKTHSNALAECWFASRIMDKSCPSLSHRFPLGIWLAMGFGAFVLVGSIALVGFFQHLGHVESRVELQSLGRTNALFLDQSSLPQSAYMATQLGQVMGAEVRFLNAGSEEAGHSADGRAVREGDILRVGFPLASGREVWFAREAGPQGVRALWNRRDARLALAGFWSLSLLFSLWISRMVTRPLAALDAALPKIGGDAPPGPLPDHGPREIVRLAATLHATHDAILEEREKRRHAERLALLGRMAASLAHEVRNPVAAIRLHAQLIERVAADDEVDTSARVIVAEATRIESLVNQWLHYAKPEPIARVPVDVAGLTSEVAETLKPQAVHSGVRIVIEVPISASGSPVVLGDRDRLRQVIGNLLLNAIQSMPMGGRVIVRVLPGILEIEDEGTGFSEAAMETFGQPFHSEREGGMGLGIAVSKEILEAHGARLHVDNLPRCGARVCVHWHDHAAGTARAHWASAVPSAD